MTTFTRFDTREEWLVALTDTLRPCLEKAGHPLPDQLRLSCGWPKSGGTITHRKWLGATWGGAPDGVLQIYVSPVLVDIVSDHDGRDVGGTLVHELVHAQVGLGAKHGPAFKRVAGELGLVPPWSATIAGPTLRKLLKELAAPLGPYPHSPLGDPERKQSTRMRKLSCATCGYVVRAAQTWIDIGLPSCPDGDRLEPAEGAHE
jgi:hypothetical protein